VGFRYHVRQCAIKYGIRGFTRNQSDGSVLIVAQAEQTRLDAFTGEVKTGHRLAVVHSLECVELTNYTEYEEFFIA
jgi:acylphosphatase